MNNIQRIIIVENLEQELEKAFQNLSHDKVYILTDTTTNKLCLPQIASFSILSNAKHIEIGVGDTAKNHESLMHVWQELSDNGATRHSLLINLGGGMVTDLGGFAASTFKRGIHFINIPTTLLAMVDASVGGKTGINLGGLKNEVGTFCEPDYVMLDTRFLATLDSENIRSGYAEMLKHGLINNDKMWSELLSFDIENPDLSKLQQMVADSVCVKQNIVTVDPHEGGLRKALNLGHTIGHAFETFSMRRDTPILHGYAVAYGLIPELYLSVTKMKYPVDKMRQMVNFINEHYGKMYFTCDDYDSLYELMTHDKKNTAGSINFTLLADNGSIRINQTATKEEIFEALDFFREGN